MGSLMKRTHTLPFTVIMAIDNPKCSSEQALLVVYSFCVAEARVSFESFESSSRSSSLCPRKGFRGKIWDTHNPNPETALRPSERATLPATKGQGVQRQPRPSTSGRASLRWGRAPAAITKCPHPSLVSILSLVIATFQISSPNRDNCRFFLDTHSIARYQSDRPTRVPG